jgi:hypothetical protein
MSELRIDTSFIRIGADWRVEQALAVLAAFPKVRRAIVHSVARDRRELFCAYRLQELVDRLKSHDGKTVGEALGLDEYTATATVPADGADRGISAVALDRGSIAGVVEPRGSHAEPTVDPRGLVDDDSGDDDDAGDGLRGDEPAGDEPRGDDHHNGEGDAPPDAVATPHTLSAVAPDAIERGTAKSVLVKLTKGTAGRATASTPILAAVGDQIDIVLEVSDALEVVGTNEGTFKVDNTDEMLLRFKVQGRGLGNGRITVYAFKGGSNIAKISVTTEVVEKAPAITVPVERRAEVRAADAPPDLAVEIYEDKANRSYTIRLTTGDSELGLNRTKFGPISLGDDIDKYFTGFYAEIEKLLSSTASASDKIAKLAQTGSALYEKIVPPDMRQRLWQLRDKIKSVQIQSEEPWVPWELCRLSIKDDSGRTTAGMHIAEQYEVTRWLLGVGQHRSLSLNSIGLVVPPSNLRAAPAEKQAISDLADAKRKVVEITPSAGDLRAQLASATYDALHFAGHGAYGADNADRSSIKLEDDARFYPEDLAGEVANLGLTHPIVFLNACEVGRMGTALGGMAGWPQGFINAGAGAFIGPFWKIGDGSGAQFAREFYARLLAGDTIGQAVHFARGEIRKASDPTWLAYVAYAHPDAKIA